VTLQEAVFRLQRSFTQELPGHDAFLRMSGYPRPDLDAVRRMDPPPRESAVLAMLYERAGQAHVLLMLRPEYDGVHSGQIAFPGGRREPEDPDLLHTALREFREETGSMPAGLLHLGSLSPVYIPPSRSLVTPFVAAVDELGPLSPDPREVAALIEAPVALLLRDDILRTGDRHVQVMGRTMQVPYFDVHGHMVWGATAMMIAELRALLSDRSPAASGH
jgi:8-oxo-dGTP pyrophosphatase MutT (NUDIX family)